jgi:hydroxyacylglutathione hydrolase
MKLEMLTVGPFETNCYIVGDDNLTGMVIDPGDDAPGILARIKAMKLNIKDIVLTHGHMDHAGALAVVQKATGAAVAAHPADLSQLKDGSFAAIFGLNYPAPPDSDLTLADGQEIKAGNIKFTVLHTPGHTQGGICLLGEGVVFTGDTLFNSGIGRTDLPGGNYQQLLHSIRTKLLNLDDRIKVYPGHGLPTTIGQERRTNPFLSAP